MKRCATYILAGCLILACGVLAGWWLYARDLQRRIAPPFDRSAYKDICIDFTDEIILSQHSTGGESTYSVGGGGKARPCTLAELEDKARRLASFSTNLRVCVSVDADASLQDILALRAIATRNGFSNIKTLVEYPPADPAEPFRQFRELRLGPQNGIDWHQMEWFLQEEARKANNEIQPTK